MCGENEEIIKIVGKRTKECNSNSVLTIRSDVRTRGTCEEVEPIGWGGTTTISIIRSINDS